MDKDQAIRKTQKLMAVAMDGRGNGNEAERALIQAEALIRKFGIEQAEIASTVAAKDFDWADAFHAYGSPKNPAKSCPKWFQVVSTGVANFTDTIVRLHYDAAHGYGVGFYGDRADTLFAQWLAGYLKGSVWSALILTRKDHPEWGRIESEDFRKAMAGRLSFRMMELRRERDVEFATAASTQGVGTALILVTDKLTQRNVEFGTPKYRSSRIEVRDQMAARKGSLAGDQVGFSKPLSAGDGNLGIREQ
ncbi:hypothetical protein [Propionivibrio sp.]|uniref:hypothetical protein n=1 Tax=Propionivibrio sp. TaxID=2212460 RepID=UPI003BF27653